MRNRLNVDLLSLGAGAAVAAVGALVLLDSSDALDLSLGWMAVALTAAVGAILVLSGLMRQRRRHDSNP
jgi:hypothetical protein